MTTCEHGHRARVCEVCEKDKRIATLEEAVRVLAVAIAPLKNVTDNDDICLTWDAAQNIRIAMANQIAAEAVRKAGG